MTHRFSHVERALRLARVLSVGCVMAALGGCGGESETKLVTLTEPTEPSIPSDHPSASPTCDEGARRSCQIELSRTGPTVDCFRGTQTCSGGSWGPCTDGAVTTELRTEAHQTGGMHLKALSQSVACSGPYANACDPDCQLYQESDTTAYVPIRPVPTPIDGDFCRYTIYSPGTMSLQGGAVTGDVASAGSIVLGASGAASVTGEVATCGDLTIENNSTLRGSAEVLGTFHQANGFSLWGDTSVSALYEQSASTEANRVVLWIAGGVGGTASDIWSNAFQNNGPGGQVKGGVLSPLAPSDPSLNHIYNSWTTATTTYSYYSATRDSIISGFKNPIFAKCASGTTATAVPAQTETPSCASALTDSSLGVIASGVSTTVGPGHYGNVTINGTLTLSQPGAYTFNSLTQLAASTLDLKGLGTGVYQINICNSWDPSSNFSVTFSDGGGVTASTVDYTQIRWYYAGTAGVTMNSGTTSFPGSVTAPNATITLHPGKTINGLVHAKNVVMDQGSVSPVTSVNPCLATCPAQTKRLVDQVYEGSCPDGKMPHWTYLTWDTTIPPSDASIQFSLVKGNTVDEVQSAASSALAPLKPVAQRNATASLDTQVCPLSGGANGCPVSLWNYIRDNSNVIRIVADATYTCASAPITVNNWKVFYTCLDAI